MGDLGRVLGVEQHPELAERSRGSLQRAIPDLMKVSKPQKSASGACLAWLLHRLPQPALLPAAEVAISPCSVGQCLLLASLHDLPALCRQPRLVAYCHRLVRGVPLHAEAIAAAAEGDSPDLAWQCAGQGLGGVRPL